MASALKYPFLDSDTLIEQLAGCTISDIFKDEGEESFRDVESQVLQVRRIPCDGRAVAAPCHSRQDV